MPSAENNPPQTPMREFYLRLGQLLLTFALSFLLLKGTLELTDTVMILVIFFGVVGLLMIISSRHMPKEAYILSVMKKLFIPMIISVGSLMVSALLVGIPLVNFAAYLGNLPLVFVMALALEAII